MTEPEGNTDFFISYRGACAAWARWVNWVVRASGYTTFIMDEFRVGTTWTNNMRKAAQDCRRLIPLYSGDYWQSGACCEEFDAFWRQHLQNANARFLLPLVIQDCAVPSIHAMLLAAPLHSLDRDAAFFAIRKVLEEIVPSVTPMGVFTDPEPLFPGMTSVPVTHNNWPDSIPALRWPLANHEDVRNAFAELVTRMTSFKLLAIKGQSETGKSHLTQQFLSNAQRRIPGCRCARFDFKGTDQIDQTLADFVHHLDVPLPPPASNLSDRLRQILLSLTKLAQPTLLIFDTYEDAGDMDRWVCGSLLTSLHRNSWLRIIIAGQEVPACHGMPWEEDARILQLDPPAPDHWMTYAKANNRAITPATLAEVHSLTNGKASILAKLCGPVV